MNKIVDASKVFESNIRLQMIASLSQCDLTYTQLKEICHCTDGNMATHIKKLIHFGFIVDKKEVVNNKLQTTYSLTKYGKEEFVQYVNLLNSLL